MLLELTMSKARVLLRCVRRRRFRATRRRAAKVVAVNSVVLPRHPEEGPLTLEELITALVDAGDAGTTTIIVEC